MPVTGTSSGIGRAVTEVLLEKGEIVVATARRPNTLDDLVQKYSTDRLLPLQLDITQSEEIEAAFLRTMEAFGRIDVVLNNAGCASLGEVEALDESQGRAVMETNFWGTLRVSKEAVRFFRESNPSGLGGRLLQMSSYLGLTAGPGVGYYAASKFGEFPNEVVRPCSHPLSPLSTRRSHGELGRRVGSRLEYQSLHCPYVVSFHVPHASFLDNPH